MPGRRARRVLRHAFYARPTLQVAADLLGKVLVHDEPGARTAGVIVEVEGYIGEDDPACHAAPGPTPRNAPLYGPPGVAYVYLNYGVHYLVNAVTEAEGHPAAVLIRSLAPLEGLAIMRARRQRARRRALNEASLAAAGLYVGYTALARRSIITRWQPQPASTNRCQIACV